MKNVKDKIIAELISVFSEPVLLASGNSDTFFVDAEYGETNKLLSDDQINDKPIPVYEVIKKGYGVSNKWGRSDLNRFLQSIIHRQKPGLSEIIEIQKTPDSESRFLQLTGTPGAVKKGGERQVFLIIRDVTSAVCFGMDHVERKDTVPAGAGLQSTNNNFQEMAVKNRARFETASKELDDFVYSVSHDLRAPLRRIDGFSQELIESYLHNLDETGQHYLRRIRQGAQDMGNLIDDLLKLSRISRREVERSPIHIGEIARKIFDDLKTEVPERDIKLGTTGSLEAHADRGLLKIVLTNLISNALKFTRNSESALIEVGSTEKDGKKTYYVKDNGIGFDPAYSDKLFKAFQRLHSQHEYDGTGIGLVTVKRIINSHNGRIWAEGTPGEGAVFYFTLN